jgi:hypothetical protein
VFALATPSTASAEEPVSLFQFKLSGYANATAGVIQTRPDNDARIFIEGEIEASPQYRLSAETVIAARAVVNVRQFSAGGSNTRVSIPEISAFAIGPFGRIEVGNRAGFPQSRIGFTPSEIAFTVAEYGPESGARLDPDGRLPTALAQPDLAGRIDRLTYLGYAARLYDDRSAKIVYLSPRFRSGLYGAVSYTPHSNRPSGYGVTGPASPRSTGFRDVVQAAIVWNYRSEAVDLSIGATLSHATGKTRGTVRADTRGSDSISGGVSATIRDRFVFGLSGTYDGLSAPKSGSRSMRAPYGVVASFNYVEGPWIAGGYYQHAEAPTATPIAAIDKIDVTQVGLSYFVDKNHDLLGGGIYTDVKLFLSATHYDTTRIQPGLADDNRRLIVVLAGTRFAFF